MQVFFHPLYFYPTSPCSFTFLVWDVWLGCGESSKTWLICSCQFRNGCTLPRTFSHRTIIQLCWADDFSVQLISSQFPSLAWNQYLGTIIIPCCVTWLSLGFSGLRYVKVRSHVFKKHSNFGVSIVCPVINHVQKPPHVWQFSIYRSLSGSPCFSMLFILHDDDIMSFQHNYDANHIFSLLVASLFTIEIGWWAPMAVTCTTPSHVQLGKVPRFKYHFSTGTGWVYIYI